MRLGVGLEHYCLWEMEDVLDGLKKASRLLAGEEAESPDDWFKRNANG